MHKHLIIKEIIKRFDVKKGKNTEGAIKPTKPHYPLQKIV
jgi:hypothetical protein